MVCAPRLKTTLGRVRNRIRVKVRSYARINTGWVHSCKPTCRWSAWWLARRGCRSCLWMCPTTRRTRTRPGTPAGCRPRIIPACSSFGGHSGRRAVLLGRTDRRCGIVARQPQQRVVIQPRFPPRNLEGLQAETGLMQGARQHPRSRVVAAAARTQHSLRSDSTSGQWSSAGCIIAASDSGWGSLAEATCTSLSARLPTIFNSRAQRQVSDCVNPWDSCCRPAEPRHATVGTAPCIGVHGLFSVS